MSSSQRLLRDLKRHNVRRETWGYLPEVIKGVLILGFLALILTWIGL